ncbi:MAG: FMN-binding protein, partial [Aristaeellaceae bacterium]
MSNSAKKKQLPAFLVLTIISLVAAIALAVTNEITRGPIAENAAKARREAFGVVLAAESYADVEGVALPEGVSSLVEARSGDELLGYCVVASAQGYAGPVAVTLGVDPNGVVTGAKIGDTNFSETAGFGMRWKEETERAEQFKGISLKDGGMIEAITGATMTSNAVLKASNNALATVSTVLGIERTEPVLAFGKKEVAYADSVAAGEYSVSKRGFASEVKVTFTVDENSTITAITIDSTGETSGFGTRCTEDESFRAQFIGQKVPLALGEGVDVLSGATITSTAIVDAINSIAASGDEPAAETSAKAVTEAAEGTLSATGVGFVNEDVTVIVTLNEDGTIATLAFDLSEQMEPVCNLVDTDEFKVQFIGKKGPFEGVDIVSGATFTSNGIIEALNKLFPAEETAPAAEAAVLTAKGVGFVNEDVTVIVTLNEDGTIATLAFDLSEQMEPVCNLVDTDEFKAQFIGKKGPFEGVDIVAGATYTSNGIIEALNKLFPAEEAAPAAEAAV